MSDENHARQLVVFTLGAEQYALPIEQVHEIIRYDEPRSVASPIQWVRGVISLRGRIVPVYDLAARLGLGSELSDQTKIVIVEAGDETAGVIVDEVEEVLTVEDARLRGGPRRRLGADRRDRQARRPPGRAAQAEHDLRQPRRSRRPGRLAGETRNRPDVDDNHARPGSSSPTTAR